MPRCFLGKAHTASNQDAFCQGIRAPHTLERENHRPQGKKTFVKYPASAADGKVATSSFLHRASGSLGFGVPTREHGDGLCWRFCAVAQG